MRLIPLLLAVAIAGGLYWWFALRPQPEAAPIQAAAVVPDTTPVPVMVLPSTAQPTTARLILRGRTEAARRVAVPAQTTGQVISTPLRRGAEVRAGQLLCKLNPGVRAAQLAEAEAALAEAEAEAAATNQLNAKGFAAETTLNTRRARLEAAQARLDQVRWDIDNLEIHAPFDGVLETDTAELGVLLSSGAVCATVIDLSAVKVTGFVSEREVDLLSLGQPAGARLINGVEAAGEITFISRVADTQTRTYAVEVTLPNADGRIRDGMTAELAIDLPSQTAHIVPQTALTLNDEGQLGVRIARDGKARFVAVRLLRDQSDGVWVAGLPDRADVIVTGQEFVRDGRAIAPTIAARSQ